MSTIAGNICVGTPASDIAPALLVLDAYLTIVSSSGEKSLPVDQFFLGVNRINLQPGEIVTGILIPPLPYNMVGIFSKMVRTKADIAKVNVALLLRVENSICREAKIALGSVAPTVIRARSAEKALLDKPLNADTIKLVSHIAADEACPISDIRSTAEYRHEMVKVLVKRAIEEVIPGSRRNS
jgi:carbon-monoxide dehydrogenase medium subunit